MNIDEYISKIENELTKYKNKRNNICINSGCKHIRKYLDLLKENKTEYAYEILSEFISDELKFIAENDY